MFYLTTHSTHFIYGYMASDIRLQIRKQRRSKWVDNVQGLPRGSTSHPPPPPPSKMNPKNNNHWFGDPSLFLVHGLPRVLLHMCNERIKEMFYLTMHSTHFIYGYMAKTNGKGPLRYGNCCRHMGYSFQLTARVLLYAYHSLCNTSCEALAGTRNSSMGPPHEGSIRRPLPRSYINCVINILL